MREHQYFPVEQAKTLYLDDKLPLRAVAVRLGCTHTTVKAWLLHVGVVLRKPGGPTNKGKTWKQQRPRVHHV